MLGLTVEDTKEKIVFTIDKSNFTEEVFLQMMDIAKVEYMIKSAAFDQSVITFGQELKTNWWEERKHDIYKRLGK